jgi:hypothetical protein
LRGRLSIFENKINKFLRQKQGIMKNESFNLLIYMNMHNKKLILLFLFFLGIYSNSYGQFPGGRATFNFLSSPSSARLTGLGGTQISVSDSDINLVGGNPAVLNQNMTGKLGLNHFFLPGNIQSGNAAYAFTIANNKTWLHLGLHFLQYGEMPRTDEYFQTTGTFKANENRISVGVAHSIADRLQIGSTLSFAQSSLGEFVSSALVLDAGLFYTDSSKLTTIGIVYRNAGLQLNPYFSGNSKEPLPNDIQIAISKKLRYLPFRFTLLYNHLNRWNVRYYNPDNESARLIIGEELAEPAQLAIFVDNLFRHIILNGELIVGANENFKLRMAYNHRSRMEFGTVGAGGLNGFSFGFGLKIKRFSFDFGRSIYHLGGGLTHIGITTQLKKNIF